MEDRTKTLIAIGAVVTAHSQACPETGESHAQQTGVEMKEILEAIAIGRVVRKDTMGKMDNFPITQTGNDNTATLTECSFGSTEQDMKQWVSQEDHCNCSWSTRR